MSHVAIDKIPEDGKRFRSLMKEVDLVADQIRLRAFELYQEHNGRAASPEDDWCHAERDVMLMPEAHVMTNDASFDVQFAVPGFHEKDLKVTALPNALIVTGETKHKHTYTDGDGNVCEVGEKKLFQRFDLPALIDADTVHAHLAHGILTVVAPRIVKLASMPLTASAAA